jgi:periplasmic divalent cation tolerance protein
MRIIFATCSPDGAEELAARLLEERLVACCNIVPGVRSLYWWEGELCRDEEVVMLMETSADRCEAATARLAELHPYDVPKIVVLDPERCDPRYLEWLHSVTRPARAHAD